MWFAGKIKSFSVTFKKIQFFCPKVEFCDRKIIYFAQANIVSPNLTYIMVDIIFCGIIKGTRKMAKGELHYEDCCIKWQKG